MPPDQAWFADPDYQEAMAFRRASSAMRMRLVQEGGDNTEDPNQIFESHKRPQCTSEKCSQVPFAPHGGSIEGDLKKKGLIGVKPSQYVTSYSWNVYEWGWP